MDWYGYYIERFSWGPNPNASVANCQRVVMELLDNHLIPFRISAESAIGFLAALYDSAGSGYTVGFPFRIVMNSIINELQRAYEAVDTIDKAWAREVMDAEREDSGAQPCVPTEYEVQDVDLDGEDTDGVDDEPDLSELYGDGGETGTTGTRTPFPDWQHIQSWTPTDWLKLQVYKDKVIAAAESGFMGISSVAGVLAAAKGAIYGISLPRQVELCCWATEVVDCLMFSLEDDLQKMCAGSLHSHEGRRVQKHLLGVTSGHPENGPQ